MLSHDDGGITGDDDGVADDDDAVISNYQACAKTVWRMMMI